MSEVQNKSIEDIISLVKQKKRWADTKLIIKAYNYAKENMELNVENLESHI